MSAQGGQAVSQAQVGRFATTHWSLIVLAGGDLDSPGVAAARDDLCRRYWYPVYAHLRRLGEPPADAQDLTQEFFARMLDHHGFAAAKRERGRFRSYVLGALNHFLADARDRARAQKRGGGQTILSWERDLAEARIAQEPVDAGSPDRLFDRRWALTLIERALERLEAEADTAARKAQYHVLRGHLTGDDSSYADSARRTGLSESGVKSAVHRLRQRYAEVLREEVAGTVSGPEEVDEEIRHLLNAMEIARRHV